MDGHNIITIERLRANPGAELSTYTNRNTVWGENERCELIKVMQKLMKLYDRANRTHEFNICHQIIDELGYWSEKKIFHGLLIYEHVRPILGSLHPI